MESRSEEDSSSYESTSSEEEEPKLKYQRLGASVTALLQGSHKAVCMKISEKFLALGTHLGVVYILDFNGNEICRLPSHNDVPVREISIDASGEFVASCADDGRVVIHGLCTGTMVEHKFKQPITCVALDPAYARNKKEAFVCGGKGGRLILCEKGWWSTNNTVLHEGEGTIYAIPWERELIAWANDIGVKIYDCDTKERITYIDRPRGSPRPDLYRCCLCWENPTTIIIGWADSIKIGKVKPRPRQAEGLPGRCVEITSMFQTDCFICGVAPFKEDLIILAYPEEDAHLGKKPEKPRPELRIFTRANEEISTEALSINGYQSYSALDYRLDHLASESLFYLVSPKDIVVAKPRDLDDHITWLLDRGDFPSALKAIEGHERELRKHDPVKVGEKYLEHLLSDKSTTALAA